jgi:hypothetical protein
VKYQITFNSSPGASNRCNNKSGVPYCGMKRAGEFSACSDHNESIP